MRAHTPIHRYSSGPFAKPFDKTILRCSQGIADEIIGAIDLYSEVPKHGKSLLKGFGHGAKSFPRFQSLLRQARSFYLGASVLHPRTSPLTYYYSFLNYMKALIFLHDPTIDTARLRHGLTALHGGNFGSSSVRVERPATGVFPIGFRQLLKTSIDQNCRFRIADLLKYCSDISYEVAVLGYGETRLFSCKLAIGYDDKNNITPIILISNVSKRQTELNQLLRRIRNAFNQVTLPQPQVFNQSVYGTQIAIETLTAFPEGTPLPDVILKLSESLSGVFSTAPYDEDEGLFTLSSPISAPRKLTPMTEFFAIYACMFYLGSLVRYQPEIMEKMFRGQDAWLLERFIKTAPITFMRLFRNELTGTNLIYTLR